MSSVQVALKIVYPFNRSLVGCSRCGKRCVRSTVGTMHTAREVQKVLWNKGRTMRFFVSCLFFTPNTIGMNYQVFQFNHPSYPIQSYP